MKKFGIVYLIAVSPEARGMLEASTETRRKTYCEEKSLSMTEIYQARASGFSPSIRLVIPQEFEYRGETICEYRGERYTILRDYTDEKSDGRELTLERIRGNAAQTAPAEDENAGGQAETEDTGEAAQSSGGEG